MNEQEWPELAPETQDIWNQNACFWDDYMGDEGNHFYRLLVQPTTEALLDIQPGEQVLDIACGNGNFSRHLAHLGAHVVATDFSEAMVTRARTRTTEHIDRITYQVVDATDSDQLLALGQQRFNAAVSNMALMDMAMLEPLLKSLRYLLKPNGRFVFSVTHPCFQSPGITKVAEEVDHDGEMLTRYAVKVSDYITPVDFKGLAIIGQPAPQYYFHRPLSMLFNLCFQAGFVLDGLEEPVFSEEMNPKRILSWSNFKEIPPVLVARLRLMAAHT